MEVIATLPLWLCKVIKLFGFYIAFAPENELNKISDLIEDGEMEKAKEMIATLDRNFGMTPHTVRLSTRISRIEILAKEKV